MARRFSQRYGYVKVEDVIQIESLNNDSRIGIWNCIHRNLGLGGVTIAADTQYCLRGIWTDYLNRPIDDIPSLVRGNIYSPSMADMLKNSISNDDWYSVLDVIEFIIQSVNETNKKALLRDMNQTFRKFGVAYTIINYLVTPISSEVEVQSIQEAIANSPESSGLHFERALELMADREQPDYRNSIKESISAIESLCKKITEDDKGTLGKCLTLIEKQGYIHPAMKQAFTQLYGYTSDQPGIRHALGNDSPEPSLEDARFMLIACSAFNNYLLAKTGS
ncbi:AbiJ-NTD4 domain-containing protein [Pantoea agglomerans]|uniref:AbiJ-NTD4 domain-containing protein n=1 Tax=Pantoea TaxID=53335 RepID=UPI00142E17B6|nr:hypothetical protein [Pantoea sp. EKM10T]KAF6626766.1 hypothetical protein HFD95_20935 [Pantoea sp. EKM10T]